MDRFVANGFRPVIDTKGQETTFVLTAGGAIEAIKPRKPEHKSHVVSVIKNVGTVQTASTQLAEMGLDFDYPKPLGLIQYLISMMADNNGLVMDFFAGSGTTGHAVAQLNQSDGGDRHFILAEMKETIARNIAAVRLERAMNGFPRIASNVNDQIEGLGGGFRYVTLGDPLFDERGHIRTGVTFAELAAHVFFTETGEPIPKKVNGKKSPLIGVCRGTAYYLLFNGILGDKRPDCGNVLTSAVLGELPEHDGPKVVFGEACRLGAERLKRAGVLFRHIPYQIKVS